MIPTPWSVLLAAAAALAPLAPAWASPASSMSLSQQTPERGFAKGQRLPELVLPTIEGDRTVALSDLRGKRVLLIQFASW